MPTTLKYKSLIKSMPFLYIETKKAAALKISGLSDSETVSIALTENIFQLNTESRKREIAATIMKRISVLDKYLLEKLVNGSLDTCKQIALYSLLKTDRLFFEFMLEVYREKYLIKDFLMKDADFSIFFQRKAEQSEIVASWTEYTYYKLKQVYKRILREAGFIKKQKVTIEINRPIIEKELSDHLKALGEHIYLKAMLGEN